MEPGKEATGASATCTVCGGPVVAGGRCGRCGSPAPQAQGAPGALDRNDAIRLYSGMEGVGEVQATLLYERGYTNLERLRDAPVNELLSLPGFDEKTVETIRMSAAALLSSGGNDALRKWLAGENGNGLNSWLGEEANGDTAVRVKSDTSTDALRKWLSGEESAFDEWIGREGPSNLPMAFEIPRIAPAELEQLKEQHEELARARGDVDILRQELARVLEQARTGELDPVKILEENAQMKNALTEAQKRAKELEEEIQHVKKGSIAVIKYVKAQQAKAGSAELRKQLTEEANQRKKLEIHLKHTQELVAQLQARMEGGAPANQKALAAKEVELAKREAEIAAKAEEMKTLEEAASAGELDMSGTGASVELQQRLQEELRAKEEEYAKREEELRRQTLDLQGEISKLQIELKLRDEAAQLTGKSSGEISAILGQKESELQQKEKSVLIREQEIERLKEELKYKTEEWEKQGEKWKYKEDEFQRREQEVEYQLKKIEVEKRKLEEAKALGGSREEVELKQRLEQLKSEIQQKEEQVREKERYLKAKMEELRLREQGLVEEEIEAREGERSQELKREKVKTGIPRLDDLTYGGVPFGSNVTVYGPAFVGKEVYVNLFMAEGLLKGVPVIWVLTEKSPEDVREEMLAALPSYEQYEKMGLVRYVDAYSRSMGAAVADDPNTVYVSEPTDHKGILDAVDQIAAEVRKKYPYYRLAFRSVSTLIAFLDTTQAFKFLQPFTGRRKRDRAVAYYVLEKGMHEDQDVQMLGSLMDGMIDFKLDQLKTYLSVKGICDVDSRAWVEYTATRSSVTIKSWHVTKLK